MAQLELVNKYKNMLINAGIIIVALVVASNLYNDNSSNVASLRLKISEEEKKNMELDKLGEMEKKIADYRSLLVAQEASAVMSDISTMAKDAGIEVLSVKPSQREPRADYSQDIFDLTLNSRGYNQLAKFIKGVESYENVYMIESMDISVQSGQDKVGLVVNLRISSPSANQG